MKDPGPPDDLEQTILETFDEMHSEAQVTPIVLTFPLEVIMLKRVCRCAEKVHEKHDFGNDKQNEAADWWKTSHPA